MANTLLPIPLPIPDTAKPFPHIAPGSDYKPKELAVKIKHIYYLSNSSFLNVRF